jgi:hypothetical protein
VSCTRAGSEALSIDLLKSICVIDGVERDALGCVASARAWMRQRCIVPTYAEWVHLMETRGRLQSGVRGEPSPSAWLRR